MGAPTQFEFCLSAAGVTSEYVWVKEVEVRSGILLSSVLYLRLKKAQISATWPMVEESVLYSGVIGKEKLGGFLLQQELWAIAEYKIVIWGV